MKAYLVGQRVGSKLPQGELEPSVLTVVQGQLDGNRCIGRWGRVGGRHDGIFAHAVQEAEKDSGRERVSLTDYSMTLNLVQGRRVSANGQLTRPMSLKRR